MSGLEGLFGHYGEVESDPLPSSLLPSISNVEEIKQTDEIEKDKETKEQNSTPTSPPQHLDQQDKEMDEFQDPSLSAESVRLIKLANNHLPPENADPDEELTKKLAKFHNLRKENRTFNGNLFTSKSFA